MESFSDYYPYGMQLPGRHGSEGEYRYGFNGMEKDNEVKGAGNSVNYKYRMHDPRLGRFFAVDPLAPEYPHNSPYAFSENVVINATELEGKELDFAFRIIDMIYGEEKLKQTTAGTILNRVGEWYTGEVLIQSAEADFYKFQHSPKDYYMDKLYDELTMGAYSTSKGMTGLAQRVIEGDVEASVDVAMNILIMIGMRKAIKLPEVVVKPTQPKNFSKFTGKYVQYAEEIREELGIPKNWTMKKSKKDGGIRFSDPENQNNNIRVMPGNPKSKYKNSQVPYVKEVKEGALVDKKDNKIPSDGQNQNKSPESHIPASEYHYQSN